MKQSALIPFLVFLGAGLIFSYFFILRDEEKGPYDIVDQQNDKVGILFDNVVAQERNYIKEGGYDGIMPTSVTRMDEYMKTIKYIESYASKGTESDNKFNDIEVRITFNNGKIADKLYTGYPVLAYVGPQFLVKLELADGKTIKAFTNGVEKGKSPKDFNNDFITIQKAVLGYDREINKQFYYYPEKTTTDIKNEWDSIK